MYSLPSTVYRLRWLVVCLALAAGVAAQSAPDTGPVPASWPAGFDAISIKPGDTGSGGKMMSMLDTSPGGKFTATNIQLKRLIAFAFNVKNSQLEGVPAKLGDTTWSIEAAAPADTPKLSPGENTELIRHLLQAMLASRFGLQYQNVTKSLDVYNLIVAKGGSKLKTTAMNADGTMPPAPPPPLGADQTIPVGGGRNAVLAMPRGGSGVMMRPGQVHAVSAGTTAIVNLLANDLGRMVIDKTGLTGRYDFDLSWTPGPDEQGGGGRAMMNGAPMTFDGPSIYTALQEQLGLKLESAKGPVPVIQVTHLTEPTAN